MDELNIPELLVEYFRTLGFTLTPEAWRDGYASLWLTGGMATVREYINGTRVIELPFEVRLRIPAKSVKDRLDAIDFFRGISDAIKKNPSGESGLFTCRVSSGTSKSAIYDSGEEEYRASYAVRYCECAD